MNDWDILKARYGSNRQYKSRTISISNSQMNEFKNFLVDCGCDVMTQSKQDELFRFKKGNEIGIIYERKSGNLLAHNMAAEFHRLIGQDSMELYLKDQYYARFKENTK
jgi:hypothetical protein